MVSSVHAGAGRRRCFGAVPVTSGRAPAGEPNPEAKTQYDAGAAAYDAEDYGRAANAFARADELEPNDMVLGMALRSATRARDAALTMTLVTRAERRSSTGDTKKLAEEAKARFQSQVGGVRVECSGCTATLGSSPVVPGEVVWVLPGEHEIVLVEGKRTERRTIHVETGKNVVVKPAAPSSPEPKEASAAPASTPAKETHTDSGLSPAIFWTGVGLSVVSAGVSIWSSLDTKHKHDDFASKPSDSELADQGKSAQLRTNILWGVTGGVALATVAIGAFATRWSSNVEIGAAPTSSGLWVGMKKRF